jgi:uncharacterized membrane protein
VVEGDVGRQNTVFKFYLQAWILLSVACGAAFAWLFESSDNWGAGLKTLWYIPLTVLLMIAAMFPLMATRARAIDRYSYEVPLTLDGIEYMKYATHRLMDYPAEVSLEDDYHIIRWLQENVQGSPVIMEGRSVASEYRWNGRIAINTGLPSVLGWNFHQRQQRTFDPLTLLVAQRENNIKTFYNSPDIRTAVQILYAYDVRYVIVADYERAMSAPEGIAKFDRMVRIGLLDVAFEYDDSMVYQVNREKLFESGMTVLN